MWCNTCQFSYSRRLDVRSGVLVKSRTLKTTLKARKRPFNEADPRSAKVILYAYNIYYVK
jgi:hypothetical protein